MRISNMVSATTDNVKHATPGMSHRGIMNSSGRIRATSEVNFKSKMVAYVFGEHEQIINPGDLLLVMSQYEPGDRLGANVKKFEITINGDQISALLAQVTRAKDLYMLNEDWLKSPSSRVEVQPSVVDLIARDLVASSISNRPNKPAPSLAIGDRSGRKNWATVKAERELYFQNKKL